MLTRDGYFAELSRRAGSVSVATSVAFAAAVALLAWTGKCLYEHKVDWPGVVELVIAAIAAAFFEYGRLQYAKVQASYDVYREEAERAERLDAGRTTAAKRGEFRERLMGIIAEGKFYEDHCFDGDDLQSLRVQIDQFESNARMFLRQELSDQGAWNLFIVASENDVMLSEYELLGLKRRDGRCELWLRKLRAQRKVLEGVLGHYPPI